MFLLSHRSSSSVRIHTCYSLVFIPLVSSCHFHRRVKIVLSVTVSSIFICVFVVVIVWTFCDKFYDLQTSTKWKKKCSRINENDVYINIDVVVISSVKFTIWCYFVRCFGWKRERAQRKANEKENNWKAHATNVWCGDVERVFIARIMLQLGISWTQLCLSTDDENMPQSLEWKKKLFVIPLVAFSCLRFRVGFSCVACKA